MENVHEMLALCIRSGQVPQEDVPKIMANDLEFARWYLERVQHSTVKELSHAD